MMLGVLLMGATTQPASNTELDLRRIIVGLQQQLATLRQENAELKAKLSAVPQTQPAVADDVSGGKIIEPNGRVSNLAKVDPKNDGPGKYRVRYREEGDFPGMTERVIVAKGFADAVRKALNLRLPILPTFDEEGKAHFAMIQKLRDGVYTFEDEEKHSSGGR